jgi:hypothetical protein
MACVPIRVGIRVPIRVGIRVVLGVPLWVPPSTLRNRRRRASENRKNCAGIPDLEVAHRPGISLRSTSRNFAAILLLLLVAVEFGGGSLLNLLTRRIPGYLDNPLRQNMWRAGHAHPGVWLVLGLVGMLYVDQTPLSDGLKTVVRVTLLLAPILVSLGFFLSVLSPKAERPNGLVNLIYLAALLLAVGVVTLGIGLFQA